MYIKMLMGGVCLALAGATAQAAPLVIRDGYIEAGISDVAGTLGSNETTPPGILFDPTGASNYGVNDFLTPGTPFEGFYLVADGGLEWGTNNDSSSSNNAFIHPFTLTQVSPTRATAGSSTSDGALSTLHDYQLSRVGTRSEIQISTTITNLSSAPITGLKALRTLDPDPDVNTYGSYDTDNTVPSGSRACGTGTQTGQTICIYAVSTSFSPTAGVAYWSRDPNDFLAGIDIGNGDNTIGLAYNIGTLAPGASVTLRYAYLLSDTLAGTDPGSGPVGVPTLDPLGLAALSASLALVAGWRRRQIKRKR